MRVRWDHDCRRPGDAIRFTGTRKVTGGSGSGARAGRARGRRCRPSYVRVGRATGRAGVGSGRQRVAKRRAVTAAGVGVRRDKCQVMMIDRLRAG